MGKNQQHKSMQRSRGAAEEGADVTSEEPGADVSFHTAEWHAARIAALTTERMSWEDWKKLQKANAAKAAAAADEEEAQMKEYRKQLDAERAAKLSKGTNNVHLRAQAKETKLKQDKRSKKDKSKKKKSEHKHKKKAKRKEKDASPSGTDSESNLPRKPIRLSDFLQD